jgi:hypothetical protein
MAITKTSGSCRYMQHPPGASAAETPQLPSRYVCVFHATADLYQAFDHVVADVDPLKRLGFLHGEFPGQFAKTCRLSIAELLAWAIFEITEDVYQRADEDWARLGRMLQYWENRFKDPNDLLLEVEYFRQKHQNKPEQRGPAKNIASGKELAR